MDDERIEYQVLVNHEEQYSLWPSFKEVPKGWEQVGPVGSKEACLAWVEEVWTDITPLSVRRQLEDAASARKEKAH
ncbi:MbtH family protein [Yoonia sp. R2-816]|uniref:MbtH family protein n=1 Tax=Yoonia sp. R2-816 TaxID=3342638 RepID=UPI00372C1C04